MGGSGKISYRSRPTVNAMRLTSGYFVGLLEVFVWEI